MMGVLTVKGPTNLKLLCLMTLEESSFAFDGRKRQTKTYFFDTGSDSFISRGLPLTSHYHLDS